MVGDFNGDGKDDVVSYHPAYGTWWVNRSTGSAFILKKWATFGTKTGWDPQMVGDFNGDGKDDVVNYHAALGNWWVSRSTGSGFTLHKWAFFFFPGTVEFGDGTWVVGTHLPPGTYRNSSSSNGCYWERLNSSDAIIANLFTYARTIVTISPTDARFYAIDCGTWSNDLSPVTGGLWRAFGDGTYIVGTDIAPGLWVNNDSSQGCYAEILSGFSGELSDIIDNEFSYDILWAWISPSAVGFRAERCGAWTFVPG
jgi:hypothetical protein